MGGRNYLSDKNPKRVKHRARTRVSQNVEYEGKYHIHTICVQTTSQEKNQGVRTATLVREVRGGDETYTKTGSEGEKCRVGGPPHRMTPPEP